MEYTVYLSERQKGKLKKCFKAKQKCQIRVSHSRQNEREPVKLLLSKRQIDKIEKLKIDNKGCDIDVSYKQIKEAIQKGGLLPFLIPLAITLGKAALTSGAAALGTFAGKKIVDKMANTGGALTLPGTQRVVGNGVRGRPKKDKNDDANTGGALTLPGTQKVVGNGVRGRSKKSKNGETKKEAKVK